MALERVPADIRAQGGVARMSDPALIKEIQAAVTIPVMAKARIGHIVECQVYVSSLSSPPQLTQSFADPTGLNLDCKLAQFCFLLTHNETNHLITDSSSSWS